jgi:uncharacterized protein (DUF2252 family)
MPTTPANPQLAHRLAAPAVRFDEGRARRDSLPLLAHAELRGESGRVGPLDILAQQDEQRMPSLIPLRYGRMSPSPFTFLRGAAAVMAADLAAGPRTDLWVGLCGDAHLGNFRWFKAPDRRLVFDVNDFDETLPGPFEWDVKRLAASVQVVARSNGFPPEKCRRATRAAVRSYREFIARASALDPLELYYYRIESEEILEKVRAEGKKHRRWKEEVLRKAAQKNSLRALGKLTAVVDGRRVIVPDPPRVVRVDEQLEAGGSGGAVAVFHRYRESLPLDRRVLVDRFTLADVAKKVVGVGSVGTRCLIMLLEAGDGTPLFLQLKQAVPSVLEPHLGASLFEHAGQRVVEGQRLIQATSDMFLGWTSWQDEDGRQVEFYLRQLWDGKGKLDAEAMRPKRLALYARLCGKTLAFAHARSGDPSMIHGYLGDDDTFDEAIVEFAERYAERTERDHAQLSEAIDDGAIEVLLE